MSNLTEKLITIQKELKAPKNQYNSFGKYKYRSAEDILEAVKPLNAEHGVLLTLTDEPILIGDWHYIKATATVTDGKTSFSVNAFARESENKKGMDHSQVTGTASSYARKYALNGLYLIDDTKDADTDEYTNQNNRSNAKPISSKQLGYLKVKALEFAKMRGKKQEDVFRELKITDATKLTSEQASKCIKTVEGWIAKASESK